MSPIKFYIYGVPDGFDMLSGTMDDKSYFETFYDTSKKGTELKVNRNINGETIYSYMVYDLVSCKGRSGAFLGMSVVFSNYEYCNDVRSLSDLFTGVLQNVILKKEILLASGETGVVYFKVSRFKDQSGECNNVGEIIRFNIQEKLAHTIVRYDNTFTRNKEGRILTVPFNLPNTDFLKVFKDYVWVSFSTEKKIFQPPTPSEKTTDGGASGTSSNNDEQLSPDYLVGLRKKTSDYKDLIIEAFNGNRTIEEAISTALKEVSSHLNVLREFARRQAGLSELKQEYESIYVNLKDRLKDIKDGDGSGPGPGPFSPQPPGGLWERFLKSKASKVAVILVFVVVFGYGAYMLVPKNTSVFSNEKKTVADIGSEKEGGQDDKGQNQEPDVKPEEFSVDSLQFYEYNKDFIGADKYICRFEEGKKNERREILSEALDNWFLASKNSTSKTKESLESLKKDIGIKFPSYAKEKYLEKVNEELQGLESDKKQEKNPPKKNKKDGSVTPTVTIYKADSNYFYKESNKINGVYILCKDGAHFVVKGWQGPSNQARNNLKDYMEFSNHKNETRIRIITKDKGTHIVKIGDKEITFDIQRTI